CASDSPSSRQWRRTVAFHARRSQIGPVINARGLVSTGTAAAAESAAMHHHVRGVRITDNNASQIARYHPRFVGVLNISTSTRRLTPATHHSTRSASLRTRWRNPGSAKVARANAVIAIVLEV